MHIAHDCIRFHLPHHLAETTYSCGAAAVRCVAEYFGFGPTTEAAWRKLLLTNSTHGTPPSHIVRCLNQFKLKVVARKNLQLEQLVDAVDRGCPVICPIQAWGTYYQYRKIDSGHYVVLIGYDDRNFYFEDSSIRRARGWITQAKFLNRWHDTDMYGTYFNQSGLIIECRSQPVRECRLFKAIEIV